MDKAPSRVNQRIFILKGLFPFLATFAKSTVAVVVAVAVATRQVGSCVKTGRCLQQDAPWHADSYAASLKISNFMF